MAKPIKFQFAGGTLEFEMHKIDRSRLYGSKESEVFDENGNSCELTTLADDGKTLIGKGGTGIGYLTADGNWADKSGLKPVGLDGQPIIPVPSSFAAPILLEQKCSAEDYLDHNVRLVYLLEQKTISEALFLTLKDGVIFKFPYSYRGGLVSDVGFILMNEHQQIFFLVGEPGNVEYKSLRQAAAVAEIDNDSLAPETADELMDFGMI